MTASHEESPGTALFEAIQRGELDAAVAQVQADPTLIHARDPALGSTPLIFAAHRGQLPVVAALLQAGADVHAREAASDTTALHWAAEMGIAAVAELLLAHGAALEHRDQWFRLTPLGWALVVRWAPQGHQDRPAVARLLRAAGAREDIFTALPSGLGAIRAVAEADPGAVAQRMGFVSASMTALHLSVARGLKNSLTLLVELGADVHAHTDDGLTPLALALARGDAAQVELLRGLGAREDVATALVTGDLATMAARLREEPQPPALLAAWLALTAKNGRVEALGPLLRGGAAVDARTRRLLGETTAEVTALHLAAREGHAAAVESLLAAGAAVDGLAGPGLPTPLHVAAGNGHVEVVRALLARGADVTAQEAVYGATPLEWAEFNAQAEVAVLLAGA
ncbi:ankyrin repeat domain-containing protein [Nannocystis sp. ILAH1]|uniref:ankyrin repeat domain-containing protein n=1 Tax=unclassified Nannocystis TaxID=2627009 RepID=UPI00226EA9E3|nr:MULTISPECIES: ankyrin repeat domain-containing protein [unclassified Nannocystis]MCY0991993.1 ankyrin repeat domain-containing protein [Nannocystis sp. ILAH1]MCY1064242.1 ankyrin repeat domain-containing protein [Nannocystis sp. RBIL2]